MSKEASRPHGRDLRQGRVSEPNRMYSITTVTLDRRKIFSDFHNARCLIRVLQGAESLGQAHTLCFVVMPDHLHWLMQLGEGQDLSAVVRTVKPLSSKNLGYRIWQKGFHDHAVDP